MDLDALSACWFVQPGDVVLDIGAFRGKTAALYLGRGAEAVYAFEPLERNRRRIPPPVLTDPRLRLQSFALADFHGEAPMIVPDRNSGGSTLSPAYFEQTKQHADDTSEAEFVEVRRLDDLGLPPARFWKIDAEGAELAILRGAERTLRRSPPEIMQVEIFWGERTLYLDTLNHIADRFPYFWALGIRGSGTLVYYDVTSETVSSSRFHEELGNAKTPHYYASLRPFQHWVAAGG